MVGCAIRHLDVQPLIGAVGVEIRGLDVSGNPDDTTIDAIRTAFSRHGVVLFRDQSVDAPGLAAFSRRFGRLAHSGNQRYSAPDAADVMLVGNLVVVGEWKSMFTNGMEDWHVDQIYRQNPNTGALLYAVEVPPVGGDTLFAGMTAAWDALDDATKARIAPLTPDVIAAHPPATHPLVRVHPESGRKSLCISPEVMSHIIGMDPEASLALARALAWHGLAERFVYRHRWRARPRDVGQPLHHAQRDGVRYDPLPPSALSHHHRLTPAPRGLHGIDSADRTRRLARHPRRHSPADGQPAQRALRAGQLRGVVARVVPVPQPRRARHLALEATVRAGGAAGRDPDRRRLRVGAPRRHREGSRARRSGDRPGASRQ